MNVFLKPVKSILFTGFICFSSFAQPSENYSETWGFDSIYISKSTSAPILAKPIVVAVIDDGFNLSHKDLNPFILQHPGEKNNNQLDDDGNNYIDDLNGWDISDNDNDVSVPQGREKEYFHGTYIASIITKIGTLHFGESASDYIKILPIKVLSDHATSTYIKDGYKGVKYAIENGADIICLAWSGGNPGDKDLAILDKAIEKNILVVASAGNLRTESIYFPAKAPRVFAVTATNIENRKTIKSNYGYRADLSAPGEFIKGAHPMADNAYITDDGTSPAAALVAGCAAVLSCYATEDKHRLVKEALVNASSPLNQSSEYSGKLGAGILNFKNSLDYILSASERDQYFSELRPKGTIVKNVHSSTNKWEIKPPGSYHGFTLTPSISNIKKPDKHVISVLLEDTVWNQYKLSNLPQQLFVPGNSFVIESTAEQFKKDELLRINYIGKTIDSTTLYCSDTRYFTTERGRLNDGSAENNYANNCSCKWLITAPSNTKIKFTFDQLDTQPHTDYVYLVDGKTAIPENFIAKVSGKNLPPVLYSRTNEVLIWFVTDGSITGKGWNLKYEFIKE